MHLHRFCIDFFLEVSMKICIFAAQYRNRKTTKCAKEKTHMLRRTKNTIRLLPEACYYAGRFTRDLGDAPQALDYFHQALDSCDIEISYLSLSHKTKVLIR